MTTATIAPGQDIKSLRARLQAAIERRGQAFEGVERAQKNASAAALIVQSSKAALTEFHDLEARISGWRANELKAGRDLRSELPADLQKGKQERSLAQDQVREAEGVLELVEGEVTAAVDELNRAEQNIRDAALPILQAEIERIAGETIRLREAYLDHLEVVSAFMPSMFPGVPISISPVVADAQSRNARTYPVAYDPATEIGKRWTRFFEALQQDAAAQFEQY